VIGRVESISTRWFFASESVLSVIVPKALSERNYFAIFEFDLFEKARFAINSNAYLAVV